MGDGFRLDRAASVGELPAVLHEVVCQGRHVLSLEDVPHCSCSTVPASREPRQCSLVIHISE